MVFLSAPTAAHKHARTDDLSVVHHERAHVAGILYAFEGDGLL
jgi:hypothetical protein